jgi:phosphoribosylglycinamide formyltransferase 1
MIKIGVLGSTRGTHLAYLVDAIQCKKLSASIEIVISSKSEALIVDRAKSLGLAASYINATGFTREEFDKQISALLKKYSVDLVVLMGYMRILSAAFLADWNNKIINVHPSLLPAHARKMDLDVHKSVLSAGDKESGCTVHYVTEEVDAGPIILQKTCPVFPHDTPESLKVRVQALESEALIEAIRRITTP